jgi:hypothetical protein
LAGLQGSGNKKVKIADIICIFGFAYFDGALFSKNLDPYLRLSPIAATAQFVGNGPQFHHDGNKNRAPYQRAGGRARSRRGAPRSRRLAYKMLGFARALAARVRPCSQRNHRSLAASTDERWQ